MSPRKFRGRSAGWWLVAALFVSTALVTVGPAPAFATVMADVPLPKLIAESDAIVVGSVTKTGTRLVMGAGDAKRYTFTTVRVTRWLKGQVAGTGEVVIQEIGGVDAEGGTRIDGTPTYKVGEQVVVFLAKHPAFPGRYRTYGMVQGKFTILRGAPGVDATVTRDLSSVSLAHLGDADTETRIVAGAKGVSSSLNELINRIAQGVTAAGGAR